MILVTGATGFLGHNLVPALVAAGYPVRALVRPTSDATFLKRLGVEIAVGDLADRESVLQAMDGSHSVVHGGGLFRLWGDARAFERSNVEGTAYMLEAALRHNVERFIHISSIAAIGRPEPGRVIDESHPLRPLDDYQRSKFDAENVVRMYHLTAQLPVIILRAGAFYGPWGRYAWNRLFFEDPLKGLRIQVHSGRRLTFPVFVPDVAQAVLSAFTRGRPGEVYNVCGDPISHREANRIISRHAGISPRRVNVPDRLLVTLAREMARLAERSGREPYFPLSLEPYVFCDWPVTSLKARNELGFEPTPFDQGACRTVEWYREIGFLKNRR